MASAVDPGRIVEEALAENPVAAPFLQGNLVETTGLAVLVGQLKIPVNGNTVAFERRGNADGYDLGHALQHRALMRHKAIAADAGRSGILLHAGVLGVIALDRAGMIAGDDSGDELVEAGARRHAKLPE